MITMGKVQELFNKNIQEYLEFDNIKLKRSKRSDVHAFITLDELFPRKDELILLVEEDELYLDIRDEEIELLTEDIIIDLLRCGVRYNNFRECLFIQF